MTEYKCPEHEGYPRRKFEAFWHERCPLAIPDDADPWIAFTCAAILQSQAVRKPHKIQVRKDGKWWRVLKTVFEDDMPDHDEAEWHAAQATKGILPPSMHADIWGEELAAEEAGELLF